jgi:hypothetical protein
MNKSSTATEMQVELRRKNLRLALILVSVVAVFFIGFVVKVILLGAPK